MQVIETDLGEYLLQISGDKPSHIVVPAIHKDRHQIRKDLSENSAMKVRKRLKI